MTQRLQRRGCCRGFYVELFSWLLIGQSEKNILFTLWVLPFSMFENQTTTRQEPLAKLKDGYKNFRNIGVSG